MSFNWRFILPSVVLCVLFSPLRTYSQIVSDNNIAPKGIENQYIIVLNSVEIDGESSSSVPDSSVLSDLVAQIMEEIEDHQVRTKNNSVLENKVVHEYGQAL